ncbi:MAG TPA: GGDEF domain-containing protein [Patescibacteria group bacterium]|nr:GGDEF domain-containing protein [Patescibacteria group bacterium]
MMALDGSRKDFLTNCFMKEDLMPFLQSVWAESKAYTKPFSILLIDVDHFKSFNDTYGHLDGDEVLKYFSSSLRLSLGEQAGIPFRFGGDEFVVVLPGKTAAETYALACRLAKNIKSRHFLLKGRQFKMSFSGGVASYPQDGQTAEEILDRADKAVYSSKRSGRGHTTQYSKRWLNTLKVFGPVVLIVLIAAGLFLLNKYYYKGQLGALRRINAVQISIPRFEAKSLDTVYLKSGGYLKGTITNETADELELRLKLDRGQGTMVLKKSDIKYVEKGQKPTPDNPAK